MKNLIRDGNFEIPSTNSSRSIYLHVHVYTSLYGKATLTTHSNSVSTESLEALASRIQGLLTAREIDERAGSCCNGRRRRSCRIQNALRPLNFITLEQSRGRGGNCVARDFPFELRSSEKKKKRINGRRPFCRRTQIINLKHLKSTFFDTEIFLILSRRRNVHINLEHTGTIQARAFCYF